MKISLKNFSQLVILLISFNSFSQKPPIKLGDITREEIDMQQYDLDPDADAVVLCDYGYLHFNYNIKDGQWENYLKRICRIKIFNDDGYRWATDQISLYDDNKVEQSISQIKGYTYNIENGKIEKSKLEKDNIFTEKASEYYDRVKFTLPNVKEGSVIEFSYTIHSNYLTILDRWTFQRSIPVKWSEYVVNIPEYLTYLKNSQGFGSFYKFETSSRARSITWTQTERPDAYSGNSGGISSGKKDYQDNVYHWIAKDLPGLKDEKFVGNFNNYMLGVDFQLSNYRTFSDKNHPVLSSWDQVVEKFIKDYEDFGPNMKKRNFYKDITDKIITEYPEPAKRTEATYNFVSQYMKWNKKERYIPSQNIKKTFDERTGSSADINALLVSMLRAVEINADPVIISTIDNGQVHPLQPILDKYNYLIVKVTLDDKSVLLDATEKDLPFGLLPYRCLNQRGYVISETNPGWVSLNPVKGMEKTAVCMMTLDPKGLLTGSISYKNEGYSAVSIRNKINQEGEEKYIEDFKGTHTDWSIHNIEIDAPKAIHEPVKEKIEFEVSGAAESIGNIIYINPIISEKMDENPFKQEKRDLPIEFIVPMKNTYLFNLIIPEGYTVDELPATVNLVTPDRTANLKYAVQVMGNRLQLLHSWQIDESFYAPNKFIDLKEFYAMLVSKQNEQIVLKKVVSN